MGDLTGAKNRYAGVFLTPDPVAPKGPLEIYRVGTYRIRPLRIHRAADPEADAGAMASIYPGAYDPAMNYDEAQPARTELLALGNVQGVLPSVAGPHTLVVRGFLDVPESGR